MNRLCKRLTPVFFLILAGCATNDFKVVDALKDGITQAEAKEIIASYGFTVEQSLTRPELGWPDSDESFANLAGRAKRIEAETGLTVATAEYYPVGHGMFGFGQLFLFYDGTGKLLYHYRRQIN